MVYIQTVLSAAPALSLCLQTKLAPETFPIYKTELLTEEEVEVLQNLDHGVFVHLSEVQNARTESSAVSDIKKQTKKQKTK